jgi:hypothetical protein
MMNTVWLFSKDQDNGWRWQHVSIHRVVIEESLTSFGEYASCLANAKQNGYVFHPAHGNKLEPLRRPRAAR